MFSTFGVDIDDRSPEGRSPANPFGGSTPGDFSIVLNDFMKPEARPLPIRLKQPFRIAHGTSQTRLNAIVRIGTGFGEAGLPPYLGTTAEDVVQWVENLNLELPDDGPAPAIHHVLDCLPDGPPAARCAVDMALHDLWGKALQRPLYELLGLDPQSHSPVTFVTLSIPESVVEVREYAAAFGPQDRLKLKVGCGDPDRDLAFIRAAREVTPALMAVDANGAWTIPQAVDMLPRLASLGLAFVEQPIAPDDSENWHLLRRMLSGQKIPALVADESVFSTEDIIALSGAADGVNVKLAKCGGIEAARNMFAVARALDMRVLLGCMIESSLAVSAAAHIAPLVDYVDLDAPLLIADDPFDAVRLERGRVLPTNRPGLGAVPTGRLDLF